MASGKQIKAAAQILSRWANVRETAKPPQDRLVVQARDGVLKLVAMAPYGTVVLPVHTTEQTFNRHVIAARPFLQWAKSLKAKDEVTIVGAGKDWERGVKVGDTLFERIDTKVPSDIVKPFPLDNYEYVELDADELSAMTDALADDFGDLDVVQFVGGTFHDDGKQIYVYASDNRKWGRREYSGSYGGFGCIEAPYVRALAGLGSGRLIFNVNSATVAFVAAGAVAFGRYHHFAFRIPTDLQIGAGIKERTVVDRGELKRELKGALDKSMYNVLQCNTNVNFKWFETIVKALPDEKIGIGVREGDAVPVNIRGSKWQIELMPLDLRPKEKSNQDRRISLPGIYDDSSVSALIS